MKALSDIHRDNAIADTQARRELALRHGHMDTCLSRQWHVLCSETRQYPDQDAGVDRQYVAVTTVLQWACPECGAVRRAPEVHR